MLRKFALAVVSLAVGGVSAKADFLTQQAAVQRQQINPADSTLNNMVRLNYQGGVSYQNTFNNAVTGALSVGDRTVSVAAVPLVNFNTAAGATIPFPGAFPNGAALIAVTEARITALTAMGPTVQFDRGRLWIVPLPNQNVTPFNTGDPSTWGNVANAVARYTLGAPDTVMQGNPQATGATFAAGQINNITLNLGAPQQSQGRTLHFEDPNNTGAAGLNSFVNVTTFDGVPPGPISLFEGLFSVFNETIDDPSAAPFNINAADLAVLNGIVAAAGLPGLTQFASGLGNNPATDAPGLYSPGNAAGGGAGSGDFPTVLSIEQSPGVAFRQDDMMIPEPLTLAVWGVMAGGVALGVKRRRLKTA